MSTKNGQLNVTRKIDSDLVAFKDEGHLDSNCKDLGAQCTDIYNKPCDVCHCVAPFSTFVTSENQCRSMHEITAESCQTAKVISTFRIPVLSTSNDRIRMKLIPAFRCETIKNGNPEFFSKNGTWVRMIDVTCSVERQRRKRRSGWRLSFGGTAISRMQSNYPGRIIRTGMRCTIRPKDHFMEFCLVLKIAGTLKVRERDQDYFHPRPVTPGVSTRTVYTDSTTINTKASTSPSSTPTTSVLGSQKKDEQSEENKGKNSQLIWIITTVLVVVIVVLIAIMLCIYYRHRKANQSNSGSHSPSVTFQKTDGASISCTQAQQSHNRHDDNVYDAGDHIYATIPETIAVRDLPPCTSSEYQELHKEYQEDRSVYQPLVHQNQELQYVDILPEPSPAPV